jgi:hypothetical protein
MRVTHGAAYAYRSIFAVIVPETVLYRPELFPLSSNIQCGTITADHFFAGRSLKDCSGIKKSI